MRLHIFSHGFINNGGTCLPPNVYTNPMLLNPPRGGGGDSAIAHDGTHPNSEVCVCLFRLLNVILTVAKR